MPLGSGGNSELICKERMKSEWMHIIDMNIPMSRTSTPQSHGNSKAFLQVGLKAFPKSICKYWPFVQKATTMLLTAWNSYLHRPPTNTRQPVLLYIIQPAEFLGYMEGADPTQFQPLCRSISHSFVSVISSFPRKPSQDSRTQTCRTQQWPPTCLHRNVY